MKKQQRSTQLTYPLRKKIVLRHAQACITSLGRIIHAPLASLLTIAVIGIALSLPIGLLMLLHNTNQLTKNWNDNTQISLYLKSSITEQQATTLMNQLRVNKDIANVNYISPNQGLEQFEKQTNIGSILSQLPNNPIPGVIEITPTVQLNSPQLIQPLINQLKQLPQVSQAQLDMQWVKRLFNVVEFVSRALYAIGILLALGVLLIIGNTMRLTLQQAQHEIKVLQLLGATKSFIRRPFLYTGMLYGIFGGILAWIIVDIVLAWLNTPIRNLLLSYQNSYTPHGLPIGLVLLLLISSGLLGIIASRITVSHHLRKN